MRYSERARYRGPAAALQPLDMPLTLPLGICLRSSIPQLATKQSGARNPVGIWIDRSVMRSTFR